MIVRGHPVARHSSLSIVPFTPSREHSSLRDEGRCLMLDADPPKRETDNLFMPPRMKTD